MELKVWVDGIQRVVCGASYSTTCQDVVIALASAMGRTGRFTLVEKWRDSERPLFPNEHPLQSLHKWGEYAGEIRFFLVQAETNLIVPQDTGQTRNKPHTQKQTLNRIVNKSNPPQSSQHSLKPSEVESLKRSSTFSCALRTNYAALPLSLSSGQKSLTLSQHTYNQQSSGERFEYPTRPPHHTGLASMPNGKLTPLSSASSSDSSSRSSSTSRRHPSQSKLSEEQSADHHPIRTAIRDARELHPANMPDSISSNSVQAKDSSSYSAPFTQYSSHPSTTAPSWQSKPPVQPAHPRRSPRTNAAPSATLIGTPSHQQQQSDPSQQLYHQRLQPQQPYPQNKQSEQYIQSDQSYRHHPQSDQSHQSRPLRDQSHQSRPQDDQSHQSRPQDDQSHQSRPQGDQSHQSHPQSDQSYYRHPQSDQSHQSRPLRDQSHQSRPQDDQSHQSHPQSDQSYHRHPQSDQSQHYSTQGDQSQHYYPQSSQSQQIYPRNNQPQQLHYTRPDAQLQYSSSSSEEHKNTLPNLKQHRERANYRSSHSNKPDSTSAELQAGSRPVINDTKSRPGQVSFTNDTYHTHHNDSVFNDDVIDTRSGSHHLQSKNIPQKIVNSYSSTTQELLTPKTFLNPQTDNRSATLDRRNTQPKVNELPNRSLSTGDHSDKQNEKYLQPEFDLNQHKQGEGVNKRTFVHSATTNHHKPSPETSNSKASSFTSAVAYIRNQGDNHSKSVAQIINNRSSNAENNKRQQFSESIQEHGSINRGAVHNATSSLVLAQSSDKSAGITNGHISNSPQQKSITPTSSFTSNSSSQHKSAFTEVSPKPSHPETLSPSPSGQTGFSLEQVTAFPQPNHQKTLSPSPSRETGFNLEQVGAVPQPNHQKTLSPSPSRETGFNLEQVGAFPQPNHQKTLSPSPSRETGFNLEQVGAFPQPNHQKTLSPSPSRETGFNLEQVGAFPQPNHQKTLSPSPSRETGFNLDQARTFSSSYHRENSQTSLEVEEYDLDQSFPDVLHGQVPGGGREEYNLNTFLKQQSDHGVKSRRAEEDRLQLLMAVHVQQERIKTQKAQIDDASLEIAALEEEESSNKAKLGALASEICQLEKQETEVMVELEGLEAADWLAVVSVEQKREADMKMQLTNVREKQGQIEKQISQLCVETDHKSKELQQEEERIAEENRNDEELERKALLQIAQLTDQLATLDKAVEERSKTLSDIEAKILEMDAALEQKEEIVKAIKEQLKVENLDGLQSSPVSKEPPDSAVPVATSFPQSPVGAMSTSDNGEAVLKILEGRLSPRSSSFPSGDGGDSLAGVTSAQHNYKSAMAVKNPNGVWV